MREIRREVTAVAGARALVWIGGTLHHVSPHSPLFGEYSGVFDAALMVDTGTTGLLLSADGRPIRELTRSAYKAEAIATRWCSAPFPTAGRG